MEFALRDTRELTVPSRWSLDAKEQIRQAIDIVDLVGSVVQLRRQGRNYVGLCPWHDDSRPSLQVNPERQSFKCWVCDIGGDIFSFIMKTEGVEFPEAMAMLADGPASPCRNPRGRNRREPSSREPAGPAAPINATLYQAMAWAERQYHDCLLELPPRPSRPENICKSAASPPRASNNFTSASRPTERDWIFQRGRRHSGAARVLETDRRVGPPRRRRRALRSLQRPRAVLYPRRPGPAGRNGRPRAARAVRQPGEVRQFAGNAAVCQEPSALWAGLGPRDDAQEPHRAGDGRLHRLHRRPSIRLYRTRWPCWARPWARPRPHPQAICRPHRVGARRRRGGPAAGQRSAGIVRRPAGRSAHPHPARRARSLRISARAGRRGLPPNCWRPRRSMPWTMPFAGGHRGIDLERDVHGASQALERLVAIVAKAPRLRHDTTGASRLPGAEDSWSNWPRGSALPRPRSAAT